jgi:crotonobetainyl-CoA:carnitine CoA-transferase CaiB-like acyl-CoA transferase
MQTPPFDRENLAMTTALDGLRILEIGSGEAAAMAGMVLAENGAEVIKIERPGGSRDRGRPGWAIWHRGKKSVVLDLDDAGGRARLGDLVATADAVVVAVSADTEARLQLSADALTAGNPALVYARITGFGEHGPLRELPGTEGIVAARAGRMQTTNGFRPGPIFTPVPIASFGAAMLTVESMLAALLEVRRSGHGQRLHTSLLHALSAYDMTSGFGNRTNKPAAPGQVYGVMHVPFMTAPTADGRFIQMCSRQVKNFRNWLRVLDLEYLLDEPDLPHIPDLFPSEERLAEVVELIRSRMRTRTADEWIETFLANDVGADPFLLAPEYLVHPQNIANDRSKEVVDPDHGVTRQIGPLAHLSETPAIIGQPAPALGADTARVLGSLQGRLHEPPPTAAPPARLPLEGITILECGYFYATPFSSTLLAEAGARVIKVEPNNGDPGRRNWTASYVKAMVGKESVVLDLKTPEGLAIMLELVDKADVFIHNFRPGTPERLGIGAADLLARKPDLVYVYGSCFGSQGPWKQKAGFHSSPNAVSGAGFIEAGDANPPINRTYADPASALATTTAIMLGLHARERTGRGQYVETIMLTSMAYAVSEWGLTYDGKVDRVVDHAQQGFGPDHRLYATADGWVYVECWTDPQRAALRKLVGDDLEHGFAAVGADAIVSELRAAGVAAVRADGASHAEVMLTDPAVRAAGVAVEVEQPGMPRYWRAGPVVAFGAAPTPLASSPDLGAFTAAVLGELGYTADQIADLEARGVTRAIGHGLPG